MHTAESVKAVLTASLESDAPDDVLVALKPFNGKPITTRLLKVLPGFRLSREYGWTAIISEHYYQNSGRNGCKLIIARTEASVPLDLTFVEKENPSYFQGRRERNFKRYALIADAAQLHLIAQAMNAREAASQAVKDAEWQFNEVIPSDIRFALEKVNV